MNYYSRKVKLLYSQTILFYVVLILVFTNNFSALALNDPGTPLEQAGITTTLGNSIDLNLRLIDSSGKTKTFSELLSDGKPVILVPAYYKCPRLCGLLLGGVVQLVKDLDLDLTSDFKIITFSFNPIEGAELAAKKKNHYTSVLAESGKLIEGWEFFVGEEQQTKALIKQLGFGIMAEGDEFAHSAAIFILDKTGRISQFFTDIDFPVSDVRLALIEASQGKIGTIMDQAVLFCFKFDPDKGKYTWAVARLMQVLGVVSIFFVGGIIAWQLFNERKRLT